MPQTTTLFPASRELFRLIRAIADSREAEGKIRDVEIGRLVGFESARTSRWKHGQIAVVDAARLLALSQAFDVDISILSQVAAGYLSAAEAMRILGNEDKLIRFLAEQVVLPTDYQVMSITGGGGTMCRVIRRSAGHYHRRTKRLSSDVRDTEEDEPCILLADNDRSAIEVFRNLTGPDTGITGVVSQSSTAALVVAGRLRPRLIIFDLFLGGVDGFSAVRSMTSDEGTQASEVVATSLSLTPEIIRTALGSGATEVLQRPLRSRILSRLISRVRQQP
ncbi:MAG: hypothetical protein QNJ97_16335 [Myxococcota bacterium]|nr:hypothetical protein [Myxococcota bacterium]